MIISLLQLFLTNSNGDSLVGGISYGPTANRSTPVAVSNLSSVRGVFNSGTHTCAITTNNSVYCCGNNLYGQLGVGTNTDSNVPIMVQGL